MRRFKIGSYDYVFKQNIDNYMSYESLKTEEIFGLMVAILLECANVARLSSSNEDFVFL